MKSNYVYKNIYARHLLILLSVYTNLTFTYIFIRNHKTNIEKVFPSKNAMDR